MGTETSPTPPPDGGEKKPIIKNDNQGAGFRRGGFNRNKNFIKKEKFMGANPDLQGFVFEAKHNRTEQITNFNTVDTRIRAIVGQKYDSAILESIEKMTLTLPIEPTAAANTAGDISKVEEIKYGKKYDKWLTRVEKIEEQAKQVYSIYYGQCDEAIKSQLAEHPTFEVVNQERDLVQLYKILQSVNFSYRSS